MHPFRFASGIAVVGIGAILSGCSGGQSTAKTLTSAPATGTPSSAATPVASTATLSTIPTTTATTSAPAGKSSQTSTLAAF